MLKLSDINDVKKVPAELNDAAVALHKVIATEGFVEIRVEDLPNMALDLQLKTKIKEVKIDTERKNLYIDAERLDFMFNYETFMDGSKSVSHKKCYFQTESVSLTLTAFT